MMAMTYNEMERLDVHWGTRIHKMERRQSGCMQFWLNIWLSQSCKMYVMLGIFFSLLYYDLKARMCMSPNFGGLKRSSGRCWLIIHKTPDYQPRYWWPTSFLFYFFWKLEHNIHALNTYHSTNQKRPFTGRVLNFQILITYPNDWNFIQVGYQS